MAANEVVVVDDHRETLSALKRMLGRSGVSPLCFASFEDALVGINRLQRPPVAVIVDVVLDRGHLGTDVAVHVRSRFPQPVPLALMSGYRIDDGIGLRAESLQALVITKPLAREEIRRFLIRAHLGRSCLNPSLSKVLWQMIEESALPFQEARILTQLALGSTRSALAIDLDLSPDTVKWQIRGLLTKTEAADTSELLSKVLKQLNALSDGSTS